MKINVSCFKTSEPFPFINALMGERGKNACIDCSFKASYKMQLQVAFGVVFVRKRLLFLGEGNGIIQV